MTDTPPIDSPSALFQPIRPTRAFEEIAAQIRAELVAGRLKIGSRLPAERPLAEQFGVSRNTLREALRSLEHAGLLRLQKGASGGAFIAERSGEAIAGGLLDLYRVGSIGPAKLTEARIWLESVIVREACTRATPDDFAALRLNIDEAARADADDDFPLRVRKNLEFHRILAQMPGNPIIVSVMNGVLDVLQHFIDNIGEYRNTFVLPSRRRFLKHLEEGDVEGAVLEMETSLKRLQRSYLSRIEPNGEPGPAAGPGQPRALRPTSRS